MRHFSDWVEAFLGFTETIKSPPIFRRWAAYSALAGAMQRCTFTRFLGQTLYPNEYILLIAYPGVGKSNAIKTARMLLRRVNEVNLTPTSTSLRAFQNSLERAQSQPIICSEFGRDPYIHSSVTAMIDELKVFIHPKDDLLMAALCDLYDCPDLFEHETSTQGEVHAENAWFNLIGGTTPSYLKEAWTASILDQGFPARCMIVFSDEAIDVPLFSSADEEETIQFEAEVADKLASDLKLINQLRGRFVWSPKAQREFEAWAKDGMKPAPEDERLKHYGQRRHIHTAKLAMLISAARSDDLEIRQADFESAREELLLTEQSMLKAIEPMGASPFRPAMDLVRKYVAGQCANGRAGVSENKLRNILINEVDPVRINTILEEMERAGWIKSSGTSPFRTFYPGVPVEEA